MLENETRLFFQNAECCGSPRNVWFDGGVWESTIKMIFSEGKSPLTELIESLGDPIPQEELPFYKWWE